MKMGYGNPPRLSAPMERQDELARNIITSEANDGLWTTHVANSSAADLSPFPFTPQDYAHFPWSDIKGTSSSYLHEYGNPNSMLGGNMGFNLLADPKTDADVNGAKIKVSELPRESYASYPAVNMREHFLENNNCFSNSNFFHKPEVQMNPMLVTGYGVGDYPIKAHGAEAKNSGSHMLRNYPPPCSTSADNFHRSPRKFDGSFLTLGIGGGTDIRRNSSFSTREIASKLEEADSAQPDYSSRAKRKAANNLLNFAGTSSSIASMIQTSAGGFPCLPNNARQDPVTPHSLWTPQTDEQAKFLAAADPFRFDRISSSMPFGNASVSYPKRLNPNFASQSNFNLQQNFYDQHRKSPVNVLAEPPRNLLYDRLIMHPRLGNLNPVTEATGIESVPRSIQPVGQLYPCHNNAGPAQAHGIGLLPERYSFPAPEGNTYQYSLAGPFPKRLGVQPTYDYAFPQSAQGPPSIPLAPPVNPFPPFSAAVNTGSHQQFIPSSLPTVPRVDSSKGQVNRKLNVSPQTFPNPKLYNQSLKRPATESPPFATSSQRRRITTQPFPHQSNPPQSQSVRATTPATSHIPAAPHHIKWQGPNETAPLPTGHKCLLCKRDLSFTADGPVYQPTILPPVAVLPCGHTFHDHCLQIIIPAADQSKNPPCIPCAIGEA